MTPHSVAKHFVIITLPCILFVVALCVLLYINNMPEEHDHNYNPYEKICAEKGLTVKSKARLLNKVYIICK